MIKQENWGFDNSYQNQEYLNSIRFRFKEFRTKTNKELFKILNQNTDNSGIYGKIIRYDELDKISKLNPTYLHHNDHTRKKVKEKYNEIGYIQRNIDGGIEKTNKKELEIQESVHKFLCETYTRSSEDIKRNKHLFYIGEGINGLYFNYLEQTKKGYYNLITHYYNEGKRERGNNYID